MLKGRGFDLEDFTCQGCPGMVRLHQTNDSSVCEHYSSTTGCTGCELNLDEMQRFNADCCQCYNCTGPYRLV